MPVLFDDRHLKESIFSKVCSKCTHLNLKDAARGKHTCKAFPNGIPDAIWSGKNDHTKPYAGDRGIQFELRKKSRADKGEGKPCGKGYISRAKKCKTGQGQVQTNLKLAPSLKAIKTLEDSENQIRNLPKERVVVIDPRSGEVLVQADGTETSVNIPDEKLPLLKGAIVTHNHPNLGFAPDDPRAKGYSFSEADIRAGCYTQAAEVRAVSRSYNHSLKPPAEGWSPEFFEKKVKPAYDRHQQTVLVESIDDWVSGKRSLEEVDADFHHILLERVAEETGMKYSRKDISRRSDAYDAAFAAVLRADKSTSTKNKGKGVKCGKGYISPDRTCNVGKGGGSNGSPARKPVSTRMPDRIGQIKVQKVEPVSSIQDLKKVNEEANSRGLQGWQRAALTGAAIVGVSFLTYQALRARYRAGFEESARMAKEQSKDVDVPDIPANKKAITFTVGGFYGYEGEAGARKGEDYFDYKMGSEILGSKDDPGGDHFMVKHRNLEFNTTGSGDLSGTPVGHVLDTIEHYRRLMEPVLIKGRNPEAVKLAAEVAAYKDKYPDKEINMVGHSAGGMITHETAEILDKMGIKGVKVVNLASGYFGMTEKVGESYTIASKQDLYLKTIPGSTRDPVWVGSDNELPNPDAHRIRHYMNDPETRKTLQELLKPKSKKSDAFREWVSNNIVEFRGDRSTKRSGRAGEPCGKGHISASKKCRVGQGMAKPQSVGARIKKAAKPKQESEPAASSGTSGGKKRAKYEKYQENQKKQRNKNLNAIQIIQGISILAAIGFTLYDAHQSAQRQEQRRKQWEDFHRKQDEWFQDFQQHVKSRWGQKVWDEEFKQKAGAWAEQTGDGWQNVNWDEYAKRSREAQEEYAQQKAKSQYQTSTGKNWWDVLGVKPDATPKEIKRAYRKQAFEKHPDRNKAEGAEDVIKEINEAYEKSRARDKRRDSFDFEWINLNRAYRQAQELYSNIPKQYWTSVYGL